MKGHNTFNLSKTFFKGKKVDFWFYLLFTSRYISRVVSIQKAVKLFKKEREKKFISKVFDDRNLLCSIHACIMTFFDLFS